MSATIGLREAHEKVEKLRAKLVNDKEASADLAECLLTLSKLMEADSRPDDAIAAAHEGIEVLSEFFHFEPATYRDLMDKLVTQYTEIVDRNGKTLDTKLLEPIARQLNMP